MMAAQHYTTQRYTAGTIHSYGTNRNRIRPPTTVAKELEAIVAVQEDQK